MNAYANAIVWDNHACPSRDDAASSLPTLHRWRTAGVHVVGLNIGDSDVPLDELIRQAAKIRLFIDDNAADFMLIRKASDVGVARASGRTGVFLNVEGSFALQGQPGLAPLLFDIGVRWMAMVYNSATTVGYGVHDTEDKGLTPFGLSFVAEMDRAGIIKCCSHTGYRTALDVLNNTDKPTIFSHSNPRALRDHPRNIPDELIKASAATDGVVCINGVGIFLGDNDIRTETIVRHIDYVAQLVGSRHVGIGLDYVFDQGDLDTALAQNQNIWPANYGYKPGIQFAPPEQIREIAEALEKRGYTQEEAHGVLGGNMLRVATKVWP